jgi:hypothetical protein
MKCLPLLDHLIHELLPRSLPVGTLLAVCLLDGLAFLVSRVDLLVNHCHDLGLADCRALLLGLLRLQNLVLLAERLHLSVGKFELVSLGRELLVQLHVCSGEGLYIV